MGAGASSSLPAELDDIMHYSMVLTASFAQMSFPGASCGKAPTVAAACCWCWCTESVANARRTPSALQVAYALPLQHQQPLQ
jgi:hypothetical protein